MKIIALAALAMAGTAEAQGPVAPRPTGFVVTAGADTLARERFTRTAGRVESALEIPTQGLRLEFVMDLAPDGTVPRLETTVRRLGAPPDAAPVQRAVLAFRDDSVVVTMGDASTPAQRFAVPAGTLPYINLSAAILDQILRRARVMGGASDKVPLFAVSGAQQFTATVRWEGADSAVVTLSNTEVVARTGADGRLLTATVPSQGVRFAPAGADDVNQTRTHPAPAPDYSAPPGAPYVAEEVRVADPKAGIALAGTLTIPDHATGVCVPAVMMITGSGAEDRDEATAALPGWRPFREIADTLGRRGIAVLRLDDRSVGGTPAGPPGATSADFADDVRAALAYLRTRPEIDPERLALAGHSEGAMIAMMVAATDPAVHAVVLLAGSSRTGKVVSDAQVREALRLQQGLTGAALDSAVRANEPARAAAVAASPWLRFWFSYDPLSAAREVHAPVLIVQGATDTQVSPDQAEELAAAIRSNGNQHVTVRIIPETDHLLVHDPNGAFTGYRALPSLAVNPVVLGTIADWLAREMR